MSILHVTIDEQTQAILQQYYVEGQSMSETIRRAVLAYKYLSDQSDVGRKILIHSAEPEWYQEFNLTPRDEYAMEVRTE